MRFLIFNDRARRLRGVAHDAEQITLARRQASLRPEMKVLFMSGYTDESISRQGLLEPGMELLQKPFAPAALLKRVRRTLDAV